MKAARSGSLLLAASLGLVLASCGGDSKPPPSSTDGGATDPSSQPDGSTNPEAAPPTSDGSVPDGANQALPTMLAIYMVGSDLEDSFLTSTGLPDEGNALPPGMNSPFGAGSDDLREIVAAYDALSPAQKPKVAVWLAFGGARKATWSGVKYADLPCVVQDSADEVFGNDSCYAFREVDADMASGATLTAFVQFLHARAQPGQRLILDLWNHGGAYRGIGVDSTRPGTAMLSLSDVKTALAATSTRFDLLGMDACLMATLEVADAVKANGGLLVASEESEPGHGWDYKDLVEYLGTTPTATSLQIGKRIVDGFIDGNRITLNPQNRARVAESHSVDDGKTLSVIDLRKVDGVVAKLNEFVALGMNNFPIMVEAFAGAQRFGHKESAGVTHSVDLKDVVSRAKGMTGTLAAKADPLLGAIEEAVLYSRNDGARPRSSGLAIFTPVSTAFWADLYKDAAFISNEWKTFVTAFIERGNQDSADPVIESEVAMGGGSTAVTVSDEVGIKRAALVVGEATANGTVIAIWGSDDVPVMSRQDGGLERTVEMPPWNGFWLVICGQACDGSNGVPVPAYFDGRTANQTTVYTAQARVRDAIDETGGQDVIMYLELDGQGRVVDSWLVPFQTDQDGDILVSRNQFPIVEGLEIAFHHMEYDVAAETQSYVLSDFVSVTAESQWGYQLLNADKSQLFYFLLVEDLKGNTATSAINIVE
jgi:hypothetical protein